MLSRMLPGVLLGSRLLRLFHLILLAFQIEQILSVLFLTYLLVGRLIHLQIVDPRWLAPLI